MEPDTINLLSLLVNIFALLTSFFTAIILYKASNKFERHNFSNTLKDLWVTIDSTALNNENLLVEIDYLIHPDKANDSIEKKRRRWLCYLLANSLSINLNGIKDRIMPDVEGSKSSLEKTLAGLTKHPEFMELVEYFYEKELRDLCYRIQKEHDLK